MQMCYVNATAVLLIVDTDSECQ